VATATNDVDEIRRQMAQIRRDLHLDMQGVVAGAEAAADWRHYVRLYPWASLGVVFAAGYLIVPKRRSVTRAAEKAAEAAVAKTKGVRVQVPTFETTKTAEKEKKRSGLMGALFGMIVPVAMRAAQSYASHFVEKWIAEQGDLGPAGAAGPGTPSSTKPPSNPRRPGT